MVKKKGGGKPGSGMPITKGKRLQRKSERDKCSGAPSKGMIETATKKK